MISGLVFRKVTTIQFLTHRWQRVILTASLLVLVRELAFATESFSNGPIICPVRLLTGIPCPACGTTRSIGCLLLGNFNDALKLNPVGYLVLLATVAWSFKLNPLRSQRTKISKWFNGLQLHLKASVIVGIYGIAWIVTVIRWNSNIL